MRQESIHLTKHQKSILATIVKSGEKGVADDVLASAVNLRGALQQLIKMRMVANTDRDLYTMTSLGERYAKDENIIDEVGELTEEGAALVIGNMKESMTFKDYLLTT